MPNRERIVVKRMQIYLIRHGRQSSNLCNVNVDLSGEGHRQAELVSERMRQYGIERLYASTLLRAQQTAEHIGQVLKLPVITAKDIQEIDFGAWTGISDVELDKLYCEEREAYRKGLKDICYPGGESGESCYQRYKKGMDWIVTDAKEKNASSIAIVSHGSAMRAFLCGILGISFAIRGTLAKSLENTSITELRYEDGIYYLERFNDYAHLEPYDELLRKHFK